MIHRHFGHAVHIGLLGERGDALDITAQFLSIMKCKLMSLSSDSVYGTTVVFSLTVCFVKSCQSWLRQCDTVDS